MTEDESRALECFWLDSDLAPLTVAQIAFHTVWSGSTAFFTLTDAFVFVALVGTGWLLGRQTPAWGPVGAADGSNLDLFFHAWHPAPFVALCSPPPADRASQLCAVRYTVRGAVRYAVRDAVGGGSGVGAPGRDPLL